MRVTSGEMLADRAVIDLVNIPDQEPLGLLAWAENEKPIIAPAIEHGGILYYPPDLPPGVREAVTFPIDAVEYGTITQLFTKISGIYHKCLGLPTDLAAFATSWTLGSWIPELLPVPLTLCVIGSRLPQIHKLFGLFGSLCRRALPVAEVSRRLPFFLRPTLLVNDPRLSGKSLAFWRAVGYQKTLVAEPGGNVCELSCSKAVVLQPGDSPQAWGEESMFLTLPYAELSFLNSQTLTSIAAEFQPPLQMFRLRLLSGVDQFISTSHPLAKFELARNLGACIPEDPEIVQLLTPLLESQRDEVLAQRMRDPRVAIVEAIWAPSHERDDLSVDEITKRTNAILRSRGSKLDYNVREVGWKLRDLRFCTRSDGKRKILRFSDDIRLEIHRRLREFPLELPFKKDCVDCQAMQAAEDNAVK